MKRGTKILLLADSMATLALGMIGPIYALFVEKIGGDILDAGWAYFAFMISSGVVMFLLSRWEDRFRHKSKLVVLGYSLTSLGCLSYIFVYNQMTLVLTQIILGLSVAVLNPSFDALYSRFVDHKKETSEWGAWESMGYLVTGIAAVVGGYFANSYGFRALFIFMFIVSLFGVAWSIKLLREDRKA